MTPQRNKSFWSAASAVACLLLLSSCTPRLVAIPGGRWIVPLQAGQTYTATNECRVVSLEYWRAILLKLNDAQ